MAPRSLRIVRRPASAALLAAPRSSTHAARRLEDMSFGDVLFRLALVSPQDYRACETFIRARYRELWPYDVDVLDLRDVADTRRPKTKT